MINMGKVKTYVSVNIEHDYKNEIMTLDQSDYIDS